METAAPARQVDLATVAGMSAFVFVGAALLHEALGHGGACFALGGSAKELGAFYFDCNAQDLTPDDARLISAAGSSVNFVTALVSWIALLTSRSGAARLFWWLMFTIHGLQWSGYFLFSGLSGIGDWGDRGDGVLTALEAAWPGRLFLAAQGALLYLLVATESARLIGGLVGGTATAHTQARAIAWTAYFVGGFVSVLIGLLNPIGMFIVLASAAASSFGGASGLLWLTQMMPRDGHAGTLSIQRYWAWIITGVAATAAYALVLGPSIRF
jgi:hypothetical protein